eukprot:3346926-Pleurochrysis_carterae.AAC.1
MHPIRAHPSPACEVRQAESVSRVYSAGISPAASHLGASCPARRPPRAVGQCRAASRAPRGSSSARKGRTHDGKPMALVVRRSTR